jgi:hypothetical protein
VHLLVEPDSLLVEVTDSSPARPQLRHYGTDATTGRGIALVEAMSQAWGVESSPTGKTVWCRVSPDEPGTGLFVEDELSTLPAQQSNRRAPSAGQQPGSILACAA